MVAGRQVAGKLVRWACARHLRDLKEGAARGLRFDRKRAWASITFYRTLKHVEGPLAGQYIVLEPWQEFLTGSIFGWTGAKGLRRFRQVYVEVAKKNGKSTWLAGLMILATFFDGEGGAKGFIAATKRDQANIIFELAQTMVRQATEWRHRLKVLQYVISSTATASKLQAIGADANSLDGLNASAVAIDELHQHRTGAVVEIMRRGQKARAQPLFIEITTAGWDRNSICWREREYARQVLDPESDVDDDRLFAYVATLDDDDDYHDPKVWVKANPNLGVSIQPADIADDIRRADAIPEEVPALRQKIFNQWVSNSIDHAIDMVAWDAPESVAPFDLAVLEGRQCFAALDLARTCDLSSLALLFPPASDGELWKYLGFHFIPEDDIRERSDRDGVPYEKWNADELVIATPGNQTDLRVIREKILELAGKYKIQQLAYDPTFASDVAGPITAAGIVCLEHFQNYQAMTLPCSETLRILRGRQLQHAGDPVLRWCADNLVLRSGPSNRLLPDKERSREKIDAMVALIMAVGRAALFVQPAESPYNTRGVRRLGE